MHLLFINHNGKSDKNRANTLKLLNLINNNKSILKQLDVKMQIFSMTDSQITDNYKTIKEYNITNFPTLIIVLQPKNEVIEGYNDIYNVYNNEITRIKKSYGDTTIDISDSNINGMDGMDYIMSEMGTPEDDEDDSNADESMSNNDIKNGMSKFENKSKNVTTKYDSTTNTVEKQKIATPTPSNNNDAMEEMMMNRMLENI